MNPSNAQSLPRLEEMIKILHQNNGETEELLSMLESRVSSFVGDQPVLVSEKSVPAQPSNCLVLELLNQIIRHGESKKRLLLMHERLSFVI